MTEVPTGNAGSKAGRGRRSLGPTVAGTWYTDDTYSEDYSTGAVESRSYHLEDFTEAQEREIYDAMTRR